MYKLILATIAALLSFTTATSLAERQEYPDPIAIGHLAIPHGHLKVAWVPSKTTLPEACKTNVAIMSNHSGFPSRPLCGSPFSVGNLVNVTLACGTTPVLPTTTDVVAVIDASRVKIENCVEAQSDFVRCPDNYSSLRQEFLCTEA